MARVRQTGESSEIDSVISNQTSTLKQARRAAIGGVGNLPRPDPRERAPRNPERALKASTFRGVFIFFGAGLPQEQGCELGGGVEVKVLYMVVGDGTGAA